jgi:hypothetical protein
MAGLHNTGRPVATIPVYAGEPTRVDYQYALEVNHSGRYIKRDGFDWALCDHDEHPTCWDDRDEAEKAKRTVELLYERLGLHVVVSIMERSVRTYVDAWDYADKRTVDLSP